MPSNTSSNCNNINFPNETTGYIACNNGYLKTTDAGLSWTKIYTSTVNTFGIYFINANTGIGVGDNSLIMRTTNGGSNWSFIGTGTNYLLDGIDYTSDNTFYIAGGNTGVEACIMKSTDFGITWSLQHTPEFGRIHELYFANNNIGYGVGASGTIIRTTNAGTSWYRQYINTELDLWDCSVVDIHSIFLTGSSGKVYKTVNGGSTGIVSNTSAIPDNFTLYQNYPNPFNPTTSIKFDLPSASKVTLKVYNIKGEEVSSLVDNTLSAGKYTVDFDASKFNSGVYFYKLETTQGVLTKKMMLVK